ncbi:protein kintoun-like [Octopus sinensis]|uniref:Protein kintoun-like n=1 Tax=Octopus sinensis TaxID=2607531 RepID=A0A6P7U4S2_9MOLL|nr:protein kintoun-like [Octopus sinensis]
MVFMDGLSKDELNSIAKALKNEKFRNLLAEYAEELKDPENRRRYEEEITELEKQRGRDIQFILPEPGFCLKARSKDSDTIFYINMSSNKDIQKPSCRRERANQSGATWSIPHSIFKPKEGTTPNLKQCTIVDVVFHPDTISLSRNAAFSKMAIQVAIESINKAFDLRIDPRSAKSLKILYKGTPTASIINKDGSNRPVDPPTLEELLPNNPKCIPTENNQPTRPEFQIKYRSKVELRDYDRLSTPADRSRPNELQLTVFLPNVTSAGDVDLEIFERHAVLSAPPPLNYDLHIPFKQSVDEDKGRAVFDKTHKKLIVTLPIVYKDLPPQHPPIVSEIQPEENEPVSDVPIEEPPVLLGKEIDQISREMPIFDSRLEDDGLYLILRTPGVSPDNLTVEVSEENRLCVLLTSLGQGGFPLYYKLALSVEGATCLSYRTDISQDNVLLVILYTAGEQVPVIHYGPSFENLSLVSPPSNGV